MAMLMVHPATSGLWRDDKGRLKFAGRNLHVGTVLGTVAEFVLAQDEGAEQEARENLLPDSLEGWNLGEHEMRAALDFATTFSTSPQDKQAIQGILDVLYARITFDQLLQDVHLSRENIGYLIRGIATTVDAEDEYSYDAATQQP